MTRTRFLPLFFAGLLFAGPAAGNASAQAAVVGTYTYSWTDTSGAPISTASVALGQTVTVQLRITEAGGGNLFSAGGITAYDGRTTWDNANVSLAKSGATGTNTFIRTNPYPTGTGFNGPGGTVTNVQTDTANTNRLLNVSKSILSTGDPSTFVKSSTPPNAGNTILLYELRIQGDVLGTSVVTGQQNVGIVNNAYYDISTSGFGDYDTAIGAASAALTVTVTPVPEPATVFGVAALGLAAGRLVRRRTKGQQPTP